MKNTHTDMPEWWQNNTNLAALFEWLREQADNPDPIDFMEKPWKWSPEWHKFQEELRPPAA